MPPTSKRQSTVTQAVYEVLEALMKNGKLEIVKETVEGENEGTVAPYYKFKIKYKIIGLSH